MVWAAVMVAMVTCAAVVGVVAAAVVKRARVAVPYLTPKEVEGLKH